MKTQTLSNPRYEIEQALTSKDLTKLFEMAGMLHGHFCPGLASGIKAAVLALKELGINPSDMKGIVAIVETNNCFSDGIQIVTGCSFGNTALIYRDYGKTAVTLARKNGDAVRVVVKTNGFSLENIDPEAVELQRKVVKEGQGTEAEKRRFKELWGQVGLKLLDVPDDKLFDVKRITLDVPANSRAFANVKCSVCGEKVTETRARMKSGKPVCIPCSGYA